jgi:hypothetical protein
MMTKKVIEHVNWVKCYRIFYSDMNAGNKLKCLSLTGLSSLVSLAGKAKANPNESLSGTPL